MSLPKLRLSSWCYFVSSLVTTACGSGTVQDGSAGAGGQFTQLSGGANSSSNTGAGGAALSSSGGQSAQSSGGAAAGNAANGRGGGSNSVGGGAAQSGGASTSNGSGGGSAKGGSGSGTAGAAPDKPGPKTNFTEQVGGLSFDMVYVPGGTFTLGCESGSCPQYAEPVSGVKVSGYYIGKTEVTTGLWNAVMGTSSSGMGGTTGSITSITWYDAMEFACKLSQATGRKYRMPTEAEWEYAAKNHLSSLEKVGTGEEWAYNSWDTKHMGGTDPVGPNSGQHTQKTRRDAQGTADNITGRLIRSIDGIGPALRLAVSDEMSFPPTYVAPCDLHALEFPGISGQLFDLIHAAS